MLLDRRSPAGRWFRRDPLAPGPARPDPL